MDPLTSLLLRLTPDERGQLAREVAARIGSADDDAVEREWMRALERRFGQDHPKQPPL
ncbi:MAG TPA: hypothetical protein VHB97_24715 [Polyangia bacterium]|nr:hypothetical protein [Polyangia bacterium]